MSVVVLNISHFIIWNYFFLFQLHKEVSELKEENEKLSKVAGQVEYFANVLKVSTGRQ
jgi:hypothetical protein